MAYLEFPVYRPARRTPLAPDGWLLPADAMRPSTLPFRDGGLRSSPHIPNLSLPTAGVEPATPAVPTTPT